MKLNFVVDKEAEEIIMNHYCWCHLRGKDESDNTMHVCRCLQSLPAPSSSRRLTVIHFYRFVVFIVMCHWSRRLPNSFASHFSVPVHFPHFPDHNARCMFLSVALTHRCMVPSGFFCVSGRRKKLFVGKIMGKYHPLLHKCNARSWARAGWSEGKN